MSWIFCSSGIRYEQMKLELHLQIFLAVWISLAYIPRQVSTVNCPGSPNSLSQLCLVPSIGPSGGGTTIVVTGLENSDGQPWGLSCLLVQSWSCFFVLGAHSFSSQGIVTSADCVAGQIRCPVPQVSQPNDYIFYVAATSTTKGKTSTKIYPASGSLPQYSYFGIFAVNLKGL